MNAAAAALVVLNGRQAFDPRATLFAHNEPGVWYDPSDRATLFQDSAGTTPVTAVEQAVGLILDKSKGLVLGPELNGDPGLIGNGFWGANAGITVGSGKVAYSSVSVGNALFKSTFLTVGKTYRISITVANYVAGAVGVETDAPQNAVLSANGTLTCNVRATSGTFYFTARNATTTLDITNISVRELAGNHAIQPGATSRPILRSRYNRLTQSEDFSNAAWTKDSSLAATQVTVTGPSGANITASKLTPAAINTGEHRARQIYSLSSQHSVSFDAKADGYNFVMARLGGSATAADALVMFDLSSGVVSSATNGTGAIVSLGNGWYRCTANATSASNNGSTYIHVAATSAVGSYATAAFTGDGTSSILVTKADLRSANDTYLPYQRIAAATDYDTVGFPVYLAFDGSDDSLYTGGNVDFSATDKMTVWAGVTKLADPSFGTIAELTADLNSNNGAFYVAGAVTASSITRSYAAGSKGTTGQLALMIDNSLYPAPATNVLTMQGDISGDSVLLYVDRLLAASGTGDQGTGNYANAVLYIGRRNNASLPFNGRLFQLIGRGAATSAALIQQAERWVAGKQGRVI